MAGTITSSPRRSGRSRTWNSAAIPTRLAEEPELVITACFTPNFAANASSNCRTLSPIVKRPSRMTRWIASTSSFPQLVLASSYAMLGALTVGRHDAEADQVASAARNAAGVGVVELLEGVSGWRWNVGETDPANRRLQIAESFF